MPKKNVTFIKPEEPSFLKKLKEQAGYKEGPTVDTKREDLGPIDDRNFEDTEDEQPTVVVLKSGDLTAEEAAREQEKLERESASAPADLSAPILFKAPNKSKNSDDTEKAKKRTNQDKDKNKAKKVKNKSLLSFDDEEHDDN